MTDLSLGLTDREMSSGLHEKAPHYVSGASCVDDEIREIPPDNFSNAFYTTSPKGRFKLGTWSVIGLVINRMVGSGFFNSPSTVMRGTHSVGISLLFWVAGAIYAIAGTYVYVELGLTLPRHKIEGVDTGVPRSGGTVNYLQYAFSWPAYRPGTVHLVTCVFALTYVIIGNMASNCLIFGVRVLMAANVPVTSGSARGIAICMATVACFIHAFSRRGAILLGNMFAIVKVLTLVLIIVTAICALAGVFGANAAKQNLSVQNSFASASQDSYGYAQAFLAVLFACAGFEQPNYVLGEISQPHKTFPKGNGIGVAIVVILYVLVNVSYMIVVPKSDQLDPNLNVAQQFFQLTYSKTASNETDPERLLSAFIAISTFGNIVVMTFTAARIKQAIAKEGILPWPKFFGSSQNLSFGRVLAYAHRRRESSIVRNLWWLLKRRWMAPAEHSEDTPVGALFLHWVFTVFMILVTANLAPLDAYNFLAGVYSYAAFGVFNFLVAAALWKLRFSGQEKWAEKSKANPSISIIAATVFAIGCLYPVIATWVPPMGPYAQVKAAVSWFTVPTVAWSMLAFGAAWYVGFLCYAARRLRKDKVEFKVERIADFEHDPHPNGPLVEVYETVDLSWVAKETSYDQSDEKRTSKSSHDDF